MVESNDGIRLTCNFTHTHTDRKNKEQKIYDRILDGWWWWWCFAALQFQGSPAYRMISQTSYYHIRVIYRGPQSRIFASATTLHTITRFSPAPISFLFCFVLHISLFQKIASVQFCFLYSLKCISSLYIYIYTYCACQNDWYLASTNVYRYTYAISNHWRSTRLRDYIQPFDFFVESLFLVYSFLFVLLFLFPSDFSAFSFWVRSKGARRDIYIQCRKWGKNAECYIAGCKGYDL